MLHASCLWSLRAETFLRSSIFDILSTSRARSSYTIRWFCLASHIKQKGLNSINSYWLKIFHDHYCCNSKTYNEERERREDCTFAARILHSPRIALNLSFSATYCCRSFKNKRWWIQGSEKMCSPCKLFDAKKIHGKAVLMINMRWCCESMFCSHMFLCL